MSTPTDPTPADARALLLAERLRATNARMTPNTATAYMREAADLLLALAAIRSGETPVGDIPERVSGETSRIARWIKQAIERADRHGNTEGVWLTAKLWRVVLAALPTTDRADGGDDGWRGIESAPDIELTNRFWLIVREPGKVPDRKGPWPHRETARVIREFMAARPTAFLDVLTVGADGIPDVQHAPEALQMADGRSMSSARKHNDRVKDAILHASAVPPYDQTILALAAKFGPVLKAACPNVPLVTRGQCGEALAEIALRSVATLPHPVEPQSTQGGER